MKAQSKEWKHRFSPHPRKFKVVPFAGKVLLSVFWNAQEIILTDYLQNIQSITGAYYAQLISKLIDALKRETCRGKLRNSVLFHPDNAPSHTSCIAMAATHQAGFELVEHQAYSPDLAPH